MAETGALNIGSSNLIVGPNDSRIYAVNSTMGVVAADTATRLPVVSQTNLSLPNVAALSPGGRVLYVAGPTIASSALTLLNASNLSVLASIPTARTPGYLPIALAVSPNGALVYQLSEYEFCPSCSRKALPLENVIETISLKDGKVVAAPPTGAGAAMALSPDGTNFFLLRRLLASRCK